MPNLPTVLVGLGVLVLLGAAIARGIRRRRKGRGSCSRGCEGCPGRDLCSREEKR